MRFAKNPHWDDALRELTGLDGDVAAFLAQDEAANMVLNQLQQMLNKVSQLNGGNEFPLKYLILHFSHELL